MTGERSVVTCFLRHRGEVLLFRRAADASTYPGRWGTVTGYVEHEDPVRTARMEVREETSLTDFELVREGESFVVRDADAGREWRVHPFLFDAGSREVRSNEETAAFEWTSPTAILRRETVPDLWTSYDRIRPTPETIAGDDEHGSAYLSVRALEVLRDEAGMAAVEGDGSEGRTREVAGSLLEARPSMAALRNRVNRVLANARSPSAVETAAIEGIERAASADEGAARVASEAIGNGRVLTLSRSGTVLEALRRGELAVVIAESRPAREGVEVAERLARDGLDVTLCTDAAMAHVLATERIDSVVVGADTVLPDGRVVNKTGTRAAAIAADRQGIPVYVVAASDKIGTECDPRFESGSPEAVYDGPEDLTAINPTFDVTPAECVDAVLTERGPLDASDVEDVAEEHRELATWRE